MRERERERERERKRETELEAYTLIMKRVRNSSYRRLSVTVTVVVEHCWAQPLRDKKEFGALMF